MRTQDLTTTEKELENQMEQKHQHQKYLRKEQQKEEGEDNFYSPYGNIYKPKDVNIKNDR